MYVLTNGGRLFSKAMRSANAFGALQTGDIAAYIRPYKPFKL